MELHDRVAWVLNHIKGHYRLNNNQLAQKLGVNKNTAAAYTHGRGDLKGTALAVIAKEYNIDGEWMMTGKGEPFLGASEQYPEVCGPKTKDEIQYNQTKTTVRHYNKDTQAHHASSADSLFSSEQVINIEEAMGKAYKVLSAGTALSVALYMNIQQFAAALDTGQVLQLCQDQIKVMQEQIDTLNARIDGLTTPSTAERQGDGSAKKAM